MVQIKHYLSFKDIKMILRQIININNYFKHRILLIREEPWSELDVLESVPKEAVFVLSLEQFVGEERGREMPCIPGREHSTSRSMKTDKEGSKV